MPVGLVSGSLGRAAALACVGLFTGWANFRLRDDAGSGSSVPLDPAFWGLETEADLPFPPPRVPGRVQPCSGVRAPGAEGRRHSFVTRSPGSFDERAAKPSRTPRSLLAMTYMAITLGIAQGFAMLLLLAALRSASRTDRELESLRRDLPAA